MLMVQQCAGQRGQRPAQAEIALGNKGLSLVLTAPSQRLQLTRAHAFDTGKTFSI